jgi:hypothetical protein
MVLKPKTDTNNTKVCQWTCSKPVLSSNIPYSISFMLHPHFSIACPTKTLYSCMSLYKFLIYLYLLFLSSEVIQSAYLLPAKFNLFKLYSDTYSNLLDYNTATTEFTSFLYCTNLEQCSSNTNKNTIILKLCNVLGYF